MDKNGYIPYLLNRFHKISKIYNLITFFLPSDLRRVPVELSAVNSSHKVIEVGTGTGNLAIEFTKHAGEVVGIDISPDMLKIAESKNTLQNVKFILMDATKLQFPDKSFDIGVISTVLHEMPKESREKVLKELIRVTKEKIIIIDYALSRNTLLKNILAKTISLYESKYFYNFISTNFKDFISSLGLKISIEKKVFGLFNIYVCHE